MSEMPNHQPVPERCLCVYSRAVTLLRFARGQHRKCLGVVCRCSKSTLPLDEVTLQLCETRPFARLALSLVKSFIFYGRQNLTHVHTGSCRDVGPSELLLRSYVIILPDWKQRRKWQSHSGVYLNQLLHA